jgi:hypothetical protein
MGTTEFALGKLSRGSTLVWVGLTSRRAVAVACRESLRPVVASEFQADPPALCGEPLWAAIAGSRQKFRTAVAPSRPHVTRPLRIQGLPAICNATGPPAKTIVLLRAACSLLKPHALRERSSEEIAQAEAIEAGESGGCIVDLRKTAELAIESTRATACVSRRSPVDGLQSTVSSRRSPVDGLQSTVLTFSPQGCAAAHFRAGGEGGLGLLGHQGRRRAWRRGPPTGARRG